MGVFFNSEKKESYFGNAWNYLDFLVVVVRSIISWEQKIF